MSSSPFPPLSLLVLVLLSLSVLLPLCFSLFLPVVHTLHGIDVSHLYSQEFYKCVANTLASPSPSRSAAVASPSPPFVIVRAWRSLCLFDANATLNIALASSAGLSVDVYLFPSYACALSPSEQLADTVKGLEQAGVRYGRLWFDIEQGGSYDPVHRVNNYNWLLEALAAAEALLGEERVGIYSNAQEWSAVMGNYTGFPQYPLWYAHYNNVTDFSDFKPFANWTKPYMKQFRPFQTYSICGEAVDADWREQE